MNAHYKVASTSIIFLSVFYWRVSLGLDRNNFAPMVWKYSQKLDVKIGIPIFGS